MRDRVVSAHAASPNPTPKASFKTGATLPDVAGSDDGPGSRASSENVELGSLVACSDRSWTHVCVWCRAACNSTAGRPVLNRRAGSEAGHDSSSSQDAASAGGSGPLIVRQ
jgi:hypothetical protein